MAISLFPLFLSSSLLNFSFPFKRSEWVWVWVFVYMSADMHTNESSLLHLFIIFHIQISTYTATHKHGYMYWREVVSSSHHPVLPPLLYLLTVPRPPLLPPLALITFGGVYVVAGLAAAVVKIRGAWDHSERYLSNICFLFLFFFFLLVFVELIVNRMWLNNRERIRKW